ncbi:MAG: transketolase [Candidatus Magasanikbacteria bacterium]|nr:transketolase [Candidatus Magasanikbacteria bacterium]
MIIPSIKDNLTKDHVHFLDTFSQSCRHSIISMLKQSQSGHPGGSLSCIDYLSLLYCFILSQTNEKIVISNGHISPAVYAVLSELGFVSKKNVIDTFRKHGSIFEGHVSRHVPGVWYGTGPLGTGVSAASGFALGEKLKQSGETVYALIGDGESQEGQVYEMMNFSKKYNLSNLVVFMDYNQVQLTDSLKKIMPVDFSSVFKAGGWHVIETDGHDVRALWKALRQAHKQTKRPTIILGHTIMGKGIPVMEKTGKKYQADWHGKAPSPELADTILSALTLTKEQQILLDSFRACITTKPEKPQFPTLLSSVRVKQGVPRVYKVDELTDCRSAYGHALLDLAKKNTSVVALTADLSGSVKTAGVKKALPNQHIECGVAEQQMVSLSGGLSLDGFIPYCSTFGAFMTSRAKDQARVNDLNMCNVKMVATHCGLSVGKDGPTHQAIDDAGSMLGLFNTMPIEPADPNHCDRMIRYIASHYGNFYVRMGRHKIPVLTKVNGTPFFPKDYTYVYGKMETLRKGTDVTIVAIGATVIEAYRAWAELKKKKISADIIIASSIKKFDQTVLRSIKKTQKLITVEDHNTFSGLGGQLARHLQQKGVPPQSHIMLGVDSYQLSGTAANLYRAAGIDTTAITRAAIRILNK